LYRVVFIKIYSTMMRNNKPLPKLILSFICVASISILLRPVESYSQVKGENSQVGNKNTVMSLSREITWTAPEKVVEKLSRDSPAFNYYEDKVPAYTLPDMFISNKGIKINSAELWNSVRRKEILELFRKNVYGRIPETPNKEVFRVVSIDKNAIEGKGTKKIIEIAIESGGKTLAFKLALFTPNDVKYAVPVFLLIDPWYSEPGSPEWKPKDEYFPVKNAIERGYGMAVFNASDLDPDSFDDFKNGIHGLLDHNPRPDDAWGTIAAWAWGASRCMDYLVTDKDVAPDKVAVVGHSRAGKTSLWAGASDSRFAMVISNESGAGGAVLARRRYGETVARLNSAFPHWFCKNYVRYSNKEDSLPVDMHMLLALVAPRALYVDCADQDLWGDPRGSYTSLYNAVPVFKLIGKDSDIPLAMPPLNKQVISGNVGFHIRDGVHNLLLKDWSMFMDFADKILK
jgi:hypothetical protein